MKGENKQHWTWVKNQRIKDIEAEELIGSPDKELMQLLITGLEDAQKKIDEYNG
jgi:hypothetical protein|tara:strand:+ start:73 stop:234 length:162 start_codon:yes stop_codon:yes gene_type:complete